MNSNFSIEAFNALDGMFQVYKRSGTLDGSVPLRAAQGCKSFLDGNSAGLHLRLSIPLAIEPGDPLKIGASKEFSGDLKEKHSRAVKQLVLDRMIEKDGFWHQELSKGIMWIEDDRFLSIWTGILIRPAPGTCLLLGSPYNRGSRIDVTESVIYDDDGKFVPVVLRCDLSSVRSAITINRTELACLTPLLTYTALSHEPIEHQVSAIDDFDAFYDDQYVQRRSDQKQTGKYRRMTQGERCDSWDPGDSRVIDLGGPSCYSTGTFDRFLTSEGVQTKHSLQKTLRYAILHSISSVKGSFDGFSTEGPVANIESHAGKLTNLWRQRHRNTDGTALNLLTGYVHRMGDPLQEPYFIVAPWVFISTASGWSSIVDGSHGEKYEGLRGIISTDSYPFPPFPVYKVLETGDFAIAEGAPLARILPVPRAVLNASIEWVQRAAFSMD